MTLSKLSFGKISKNENIIVTIVKIKDRKVAMTTGGKTNVMNCVIEDDFDSMEASIWGDKITQISRGDKIKITAGYLSYNDFLKTKCLSIFKFEIIKKNRWD